MWNYLVREKKIHIKCNCKQKHFLWFLLLSTPCMSHFHSYTLIFTTIHPNPIPDSLHSPNSTLIQHISTHITRILNLIPCISIPILPILLTPFPNFSFRRSQMAGENDILTSLKTLSTSWRRSHRSVFQRKQFFRIAVLQSIKLSGFSISLKNVQEGVQF